MVKKFKNLEIADRVVSDFQKNTDETLGRITTKEIVDGVLLKDIVMGRTTRVEHKLSRIPLGWIVVRANSNANYWDNQVIVNTLPERYLIIESSVNSSIVSLWVF